MKNQQNLLSSYFIEPTKSIKSEEKLTSKENKNKNGVVVIGIYVLIHDAAKLFLFLFLIISTLYSIRNY